MWSQDCMVFSTLEVQNKVDRWVDKWEDVFKFLPVLVRRGFKLNFPLSPDEGQQKQASIKKERMK